jgi:RNA polymerase sigma-70 factor (sigma-E family)
MSMQEALQAAFERHYVRLLRLSILLVGSREAGEDLVQEAFIRAAPRLGQLGPAEVGPYLRATTLNLWKNRLRRAAVERRHRSSTRTEAYGEVALEDRQAIWRVVQQLPDRQRACIVLRYYEDLSEREVAEVLGCSVGAVKSHSSRAIARLRKELEHGH